MERNYDAESTQMGQIMVFNADKDFTIFDLGGQNMKPVSASKYLAVLFFKKGRLRLTCVTYHTVAALNIEPR
jgi:hypothetical protein